MIKQDFAPFRKITRGGFIFSAGSVGSLVVQFFIGIIVVRAVSRFDYGLLSLTLILINILATLVVLGMANGIPRLIAQYTGQDKPSSVRDIIRISILIVSIVSISLSIGVFCGAGLIAAFFQKPEMIPVLRVFSLAIAPFAFIRLLGAVYRGGEDILPKVLFNDVTLNGSRITLILLVVIFGIGFQGIVWSYVISFWLAFLGLIAYGYRKSIIGLPRTINLPVARELLLFCMPLLGVSIIDNLIGWTGTLVLGYFHANEEISLYSAPLRLASILQIPMISLVYLYLPVATRIFFDASRRGLGELGELYVRTTKLAFFIILPAVLFFLADAEFVVQFLFGANYISSANVLRLLTVGLALHILVGPNSTTLTSFGNTYLILTGSALAGVAVVGFCILLVPAYGAVGAAISMVLSRIVSNCFFSFILFKFYRIQPFRMDFIKPLAFSLAFGTIASYGFLRLEDPHFVAHLLFFAVLLAITMVSPVLTRSVQAADIDLLKKVEMKISGRTRISDWVWTRVVK